VKTNLLRAGGFVLLLAVALLVKYGSNGETPSAGAPTGTTPSGTTPSGATTNGATTNGALVDAIEARRSDVWVEASGRVTRVLADDDEGSRHQRFIVEVASGDTVLIAHNIDLAPRAPVEVGDAIEFRGEYEWNDRGGVVHWTHHDPGGRHDGGWLRHAGQTYR
jgi:hypothetical protein